MIQQSRYRLPRQFRALAARLMALLMAPASALTLALAFVEPASAQIAAPKAVVAAVTTEPKIEPISPADIPARADVDEQYIAAVVRRAQLPDPARRLEQSLATQSAAIQQLAKQSASIDLSSFPELRLKSLSRYWLLYERELTELRGELQRATQASSNDAAGLASRRAVWEASRAGVTGSPAVLLQRADDIIRQIDRAEKLLSAPLGKLIELGRRGAVLWTQVQAGKTATQARVDAQDSQLGRIDSPPLWQADEGVGALDTDALGFSRSLAVETGFRQDYDAANTRLLRGFAIYAALLLPLMFWLRQRARHLLASGETTEALSALSRPWSAWLVLVSLGAVLYDWQGPTFRQQVVILLAWVPVLRLLSARVLALVGPWASLSAVFYFLTTVASLLIGDHFWYRCLLLAINLMMLLTLLWMAMRARAAAPDASQPRVTRFLSVLGVVVALALLVSVAANLLGNVSLATMLTNAILDSNYMALATLAGARVMVALLRVVSTRPVVSKLRESARHSGSLIRAGSNVGRTLLVAAWLVYTLHVFRVYQPLLDWSTSILTHQFALGELSLSLGGVAVLFGAGWLAFWLANTIRLVLAEDLLPSLALPRGVDNTIATLSYYTILFLGLMAALAAAGFKVGQLTIVLSALSVGIGFGLQDIVRNFVAGLVLMFERPIQPGDTVDVAGVSGTVRDIGMRATTLRTADGADVVVPNGKLLAETLVNWTLSGTLRRFDIAISTSHNASPQGTIDLLTRTAGTFDDICSSPRPVAVLTALTPGALQFSLGAWTQRTDWGVLRSELAIKLHDELVKAGIEMPKPAPALA